MMQLPPMTKSIANPEIGAGKVDLAGDRQGQGRAQLWPRGMSVRVAMAFAFLTCGVLPVNVSMAQVATVPPEGQTFPLNCQTPDPDLVFYLDENSGFATVQITGINAGGTVNAVAEFDISGNGIGTIGATTSDFTPNSEILNNGGPSQTFTATGNAAPRELVFEKQSDQTTPLNTNKVTINAVQTTTFTAVKASTDTSYSNIGDVLDYTITVTNTGNVTLTGLSISDPLTSDESCPVTSLAPGASTICTASYTVDADDISAGKVENIATVDTNQTTPLDTNKVTINYVNLEASFTAVKASTDTNYSQIGDVLDYTITVTNTGDVTLTGLSISDPLTSNETCPVASLALGQSTICTATYVVDQDDIDAGKVENIATVDTNQTTPLNTNKVTINAVQTTTFTAVKASTDTSYSNIGDILDYTITVTNTGNVTLTGLSIDDPLTGDESCPVESLTPGASTVCTASYTVTQKDIAAGSVSNFAVVDTDQTDPLETNTVTIKYVLDEDAVRDAFESLSYNFIAQRLNLLASNGPRLAWQVNRVEGGFGGGVNSLNVVGENGDLTGSFAFSSGALRSAVAGERVMPTADAPRSDGGINAWIEGQFAIYNDERDEDDVNGDFFVGYAGVDIEVMNRVNIGIMGEIDWMNEDGDDNAEVEGTGWMIGPYLSAEIADGIFLDMRAMGGTTDNDIRQAVLGIDYDGDFQTTRWLAEATLSGNYEFDSVTLTPDIRLLHIREDQEDYKVSGGGNTVDVDGNEVILTQLSSGLRLSHLMVTDDMLLRPYIAGRLFWNIDNPGELTIDGEYISTDDVRGAVTLGLDASSDALQFGIEGTYDGLFGDNDHAISGRLSFGYRF
jgi:uncharacterized repeat protein (TIGR01451 family)